MGLRPRPLGEGGADIRGALEPHVQSCVATRTHVAGAEIIWHDESTHRCWSGTPAPPPSSQALLPERRASTSLRELGAAARASASLCTEPSGVPGALTTASTSSCPPRPSGRPGAKDAASTGLADPHIPPGWAWERRSWASRQGCGRASC